MAQHTCPNCQHTFEVVAKKKTAGLPEQITIERNGKTYYGRWINWTTGRALGYASFPDDGKPRKYPRHIIAIRAARAAGEFKPAYDWYLLI